MSIKIGKAYRIKKPNYKHPNWPNSYDKYDGKVVTIRSKITGHGNVYTIKDSNIWIYEEWLEVIEPKKDTTTGYEVDNLDSDAYDNFMRGL